MLAKKIAAVFIATILLFTACAVSVSAETGSYSEVIEVISNGLKNHEQSIDISKFNISQNNFADIYVEALYNNPEYFWVDDNGTKISINRFTGAVIAVKPNYNDLYSEENVKTFEKEIQKALSSIDNTLSDYEKVLILHDYVVNTCHYLISDTEPVYTAYSALVNHKALCRGYARSMKILLTRVGINSIIVTSDYMAHAWNMIEIDGQWYHLDATWADPTGGVERVNHNFFMLSDNTIKDESHLHSGWATDKVATSQKYEDGFWLDAESQIHYKDNKFYYIKSGKIVARDRATGNETTVYTIPEYWYVWNSNNMYYYTATFSGLSMIDGLLYFNTPNGVYSITTTGTGLRKVYELTEQEVSVGDIYATSYIGDQFTYSLTIAPKGETIDIKTLDISTPTAMLGDFNLDNYITVSDSVVVAKYSTKMITDITDVQKITGDVNKDGYVNVIDAVAISRFCAKIITSFDAA